MKRRCVMGFLLGLAWPIWAAGQAAEPIWFEAGGGTRVLSGSSAVIAYSPQWAGGERIRLWVDGAVVEEASEEGEFLWRPSQDGLYVLKHETLRGDEVVDTLAATLEVKGLDAPEAGSLGVSSPMAYDAQAGLGARLAELPETVALSPRWERGERVRLWVNGAVVEEASEEGEFLWRPSQDGLYVLKHETLRGDEVVDTLAATLEVKGLKPGYRLLISWRP